MPTPSAVVAAHIGNAWHIPGNLEPIGMMRDPLTEISPATRVSILSGNQFQGPGNPGNQLEAGSTVFFKKERETVWSSLPMTFHSISGNNQYYEAILPANVLIAGDAIQYYLKIPYSDHLTTFLHGTNAMSFATDTEAEARGAPFSFTVLPTALQLSGNLLTFDSGSLQVRVVPDSGALVLAVPDLTGNPLANSITL